MISNGASSDSVCGAQSDYMSTIGHQLNIINSILTWASIKEMHSSSRANKTGKVSDEIENEGAFSFWPNCSNSVK